jgi:hypothetical protein
MSIPTTCIEVTEWCMSLDPLARPQSVFALQKNWRAKPSVAIPSSPSAERVKLQLENLKSGAKGMRFSVYQISRKGGREKNEDRMGYCYTRDSGLFALADGMGGHPEGEVASQLALQTMAAMFQRDAKPVLDDPLRFCRTPSWRGTTSCCATPVKRPDRHAAHHHHRLHHARQLGLLGTLW